MRQPRTAGLSRSASRQASRSGNVASAARRARCSRSTIDSMSGPTTISSTASRRGTGQIDWRWRTGGDVLGTAVVDARRVYFVSFDNILRALDRRSGAQRWKRPLPFRPLTGPLMAGATIITSGVTPPSARVSDEGRRARRRGGRRGRGRGAALRPDRSTLAAARRGRARHRQRHDGHGVHPPVRTARRTDRASAEYRADGAAANPDRRRCAEAGRPCRSRGERQLAKPGDVPAATTPAK